MENKKITDFEIAEHFNFNEGLAKIAKNIISDENLTSDNLIDLIDDYFIYNCDCWNLIEYYHTPQDDNISLFNAINCFYDDLYKLLKFKK